MVLIKLHNAQPLLGNCARSLTKKHSSNSIIWIDELKITTHFGFILIKININHGNTLWIK